MTKLFGKLANLNLVKVITDAIYKANMIGSVEGLTVKMLALVGVSILFILLASLKIRENRYASI